MKGKIFAVVAMCGSSLFAANPIGTMEELISRLESIERYNASAEYNVMLPMSDNEVNYSVNLQSLSAQGDTLAPCDYLIEWSLPTPSGQSEGFSAYSGGSHYRYRDERLQEYHFDWDSIPFITGRGGVQRNAQFTEILPQFLAEQLREIATKPQYEYAFKPSTLREGREVAVVEAVETYDGYVGREMTLEFDAATGMPVRIESENNPGAISEQTVSIRFGEPTKATIERFSENDLIGRFPEVFERFRQSNFRIENLAGTQMPPFSLATVTGERYSRERNDKFMSPTIVVLLDPAVETTAETITAVREAAGALPFNADIIWVFTSSNTDQIETLTGAARIGETTLISGRALARDCGAVSFPTMIFADRNGRIGDVHLGFNKNLPEIVMQKTILVN